MDNFYTGCNVCFLKHHSYLPRAFKNRIKWERERELKKYISCSAARMEDCDFIWPIFLFQSMLPLSGQTTTSLREYGRVGVM